MKDLVVIGRNTAIDFGRRARAVPAKIDTGADSSSIWATKIRVGKDGKLRFALFGEGSPYYNGKVFVREQYSVAQVRSSTGHRQVRYRTQLTMRIHGRKVRATFNLSDRSRNMFPVLIGRRTLSGKFMVDVSQAEFVEPRPNLTLKLNGELQQDPVKFHKKYHKKNQRQAS